MSHGLEAHRTRVSEQKRKSILTAARAEFVAKGYHDAAMKDIADNAEVSTATLYKHFGSKDELFYALEAKEAGTRPRVFCASLADVFDNQVPGQWREDLWSLMDECDHLDWLIVTKRVGNVKDMVPDHWKTDWPKNVWLLITVCNQEEADRDIPKLLGLEESLRLGTVGLSMEPLLGPVDLEFCQSPFDRHEGYPGTYAPLYGSWWPAVGDPAEEFRGREEDLPKLDWIIVGGEDGPRPMHPDWARKLRDQCSDAGIPFHFKQWGAWLPWESEQAPYWQAQNGANEDGHNLFPADMDADPKWDDGLWGIPDLTHFAFQRVGKQKAGSLLDGVEYKEFPA